MASNSPRRTALSPAPSSNSSPLSRLQSIANQMAPISTTSFPAEVVPQAPEDPLFGLMRAYKADQSPNKVDLVRGILPPLCSVCPANVAVGADMTTPGNWSVPGRQCEAVGSAGGQEGEFFFFLLLQWCPTFASPAAAQAGDFGSPHLCRRMLSCARQQPLCPSKSSPKFSPAPRFPRRPHASPGLQTFMDAASFFSLAPPLP